MFRIIVRLNCVQPIANGASLFFIFKARAISDRNNDTYNSVMTARRHMSVMSFAISRHVKVVIFYGLSLQATIRGIATATRDRYNHDGGN